jgi:hypothetical protein
MLRTIGRYISAAALLPLAALAASQPSCGSQAPASTDPVSVSREKLTEVGVERVIPLRFIYLSPSCTDTESAIEAEVKQANDAWLAAGIQFAISNVQTVNAPTFANPGNASVAWNPSWVADGSSELGQIDPALIGVDPGPGRSTSLENWITFAASKLPSNELPIFVKCSGGTFAEFPWYATSGSPWASDWSHGIQGAPGSLGGLALAHEIGHYLGLVHTWDVAGDPSYYDLVYGANSSNQFVRTLSSAADATNFLATSGNKLLSKQNPVSNIGRACTVNSDCTSTWPSSGCSGGFCSRPCGTSMATSCSMSCYWPGVGTAGDIVSTAANPTLVPPLGTVYDAVPYGVNLMDFTYDNNDCQRAGISPSQVAKVQVYLHGLGGAAAVGANREFLGHYENPQYPGTSGVSWFQEMDFDGDHVFDPVYWKWSDKSCHYVHSTNGAEATISLPQADATKGDIPVPADYDGDGVVDCAVFRPKENTFIWTRSASGGSCCGSYSFASSVGTRWGLAPLYGLNWKFASGTDVSYGLYDPKTATFYGRNSDGSLFQKQYGVQGDRLLLGRWDSDVYTDIAVWRPRAGTFPVKSLFSVTTSSSNYSDSHDFWQLGASGATVLPNVDRDGNGALDLAYWDPPTGNWSYLYNPATRSGSGGTPSPDLTEQWGAPGDQPLPGFDFDQDGKSDPVVFRPATTSGAAAAYYVLKSLDYGYIAVDAGAQGDIPFLTRHRYGTPSDHMPSLWAFRVHTMQWVEIRNENGGYPFYYVLYFGGNPTCHFGDCIPL